MGLSADDEFLTAIAHQARIAYATQQLAACRDALQRWQVEGAEAGASNGAPVQQELEHHIRQIERWQDYLEHLEARPNLLWVSEMPRF